MYEVKQKKVESCDGPNVTTVYISEDVEDCPCPLKTACNRVRVTGPGYESGVRDNYG